MKIEGPWARVAVTRTPPARTRVSTATMTFLTFMVTSSWLVREGPEPQLLLGDLPQPGQPVRLHDEKEDDQPPEDHDLDLLLQRDRHGDPRDVGRVGEEDG